MDNNQINKVLEDLYQIDPTLRLLEEDVKKLIVQLMASKPDTKFDRKWAKNLRQNLMSANQSINQPNNNMNDNSIFRFFKKPIFALVGVGALAIILVLVSQFDNRPRRSDTASPGNLNINRVGANAFSSLLSFAQTSPTGETAQNESYSQDSAAPLARSQSGGAAGFGGGGIGVDIAPPEVVNYVYTYRGEEFGIDQEQVEVFKRLKTPFADTELVNVIQNSNLGLVDLSRFVNTKVQSLSIFEDRNGGYEAYIDFVDGRISINQRYSSTDPIIFEQPNLRIEDVPADSRLIAAARNFLTDRGVNLNSYGEPFVRKDWLIAYERMSAAERTSFYIPNSVQVVFPMQINGQTVHDEGGVPTGIAVNVSYPEIRATGAWDIVTLNFESSLHQAETDTDRLLEIASRGGMYGYYYDGAQNTVEIGLDTPTVELVRVWTYQNNRSEELLVPALVFPIIDAPSDQYYFYRTNVVVPLVQDVLHREDFFPPPIPLPRPLPVDVGASASEPSVPEDESAVSQ